MASIDVLVIGRNTYDKVMSFASWPYAGKRVMVLSSQPLDTSAIQGERIEVMRGTPREIVHLLESIGAKHAYIDGGITVQRFLRAKLIQRLVITRVPVLIGEGIPLFGSLPNDIRLKHLQTTSYKSELVKSEYEVLSA
jgi:dihydrofolate reductase